ncbi:MAG: hypothetical protein HYT70_01910 [Candidatus Aenigmarchaeota archaeon]|nr:hypothetical protein [Candidatus Aenigmarchaeota archaeon]
MPDIPFLPEGFYVMRFIRANGTREFETVVFPQGYRNVRNGHAPPYQTAGDAFTAKKQILNEDPSFYNSPHNQRELDVCQIIYRVVQE